MQKGRDKGQGELEERKWRHCEFSTLPRAYSDSLAKATSSFGLTQVASEHQGRAEGECGEGEGTDLNCIIGSIGSRTCNVICPGEWIRYSLFSIHE